MLATDEKTVEEPPKAGNGTLVPRDISKCQVAKFMVVVGRHVTFLLIVVTWEIPLNC